MSEATVSGVIDSLREAPDQDAIIATVDSEPLRLSRGRLLDQAHALAAGLNAAGHGRGDVLTVLADNRMEWIVAALAIIRCGATVLPIDTQLGNDNLRHILKDSGTRLVFCNAEQATRIGKLDLDATPKLVRLDEDDGDDSWQGLLRNDEDALPDAGEDDNAILFYTSGTTGPPKGVPLSHRNLFHQLREIKQVELVHDGDRLLLPLPLHHVYPFVIGMLAPLYLRLPVIQPKALTGPEILKAIGEGGATVIIGVPRLYRALLSGIEAQVDRRPLPARLYIRSAWALCRLLRRRLGLSLGKTLLAPLHRKIGPTLRLLASGGSALDPKLARALEGLGWDIGVGYGLTETSPLLTLNLPGSGRLDSVGRALPGVNLRIAPADVTPEADQAEETAAKNGTNGLGEVQARGPIVFNGYWNLPDATREAFTQDDWYRTGDLGRLDEDGYLTLQGRASTVIVTESGKNIQPDEVEDTYAEHPLIGEIGLLSNEGRLVALVIPDAQAVRQGNLDEQEAMNKAIREQSAKLPSYQRLSDFTTSREALPRTRLGKIRRHKLEERYQRALQEAEGGKSTAGPIEYAEMSDQDQALMEQPRARQVWDWLAERYPDVHLTPDTSPFMDLGIDSMEMINLTMDISQLTGVELGQEALARVDTVRDLLHEVSHQAETGNGGGTLDPERVLTHPDDYLGEQQRRWLRPLGPLASLPPRLCRPLLKGLLKLMFSYRVRGLENLPNDRACVLVPNHVSVLDPALLFCALPWRTLQNTYFAGWTGWAFRNVLMRFIARMGQTVPIDAERAAASSLALGAAVLTSGNNLIWFAEGERSRSGKLKPFKPGIGMILEHHPVTVVPVYIAGAYEAWPRGKRLPRRHRITVTLGTPVEPKTLLAQGGEDKPPERISHGLHDALKTMINEAENQRDAN